MTRVEEGGGTGVRATGAPREGKVLVGSKGEKGVQVVVDVGENLCRICHLSSEHGRSEGSELIQIGCGCKGELGIAHRHCGEAWFRVKGNRSCEICGMNAKNITGVEDSSFMVEWNEGRMLDGSNNRNLSERVSYWRSQPFCNFLMACLVIAFILPWFFHVKMF